MKLSDRISAARRHAGITQERLAKTIGVTQQSIHKLETGESLSSRKLTEIALACGVSPVWLAKGTGLMTDKNVINNNDDDGYTVVTSYSQCVGLGSGTYSEEYAETSSLKFKKSSLRKRGILGRPLAIFYGKGDSMEPTIGDGDVILFDTSDTRPIDDALYVIQLSGFSSPECYVKRAEILDEIVYFRSDNPFGDHHWRKAKRMDSKREPITIIGRVHWIAGWAF